MDSLICIFIFICIFISPVAFPVNLFVGSLRSFFCFFNLTLSFVCFSVHSVLKFCLSVCLCLLSICLSVSPPSLLPSLLSLVLYVSVMYFSTHLSNISWEHFLYVSSLTYILCIFFHVSFMYFPLCICYVFFFFVSSSAIIWVFYVISSRYFCLISEVCILFI